MHLAVVEVDLHIGHPVTCQDAFLARLHGALLHGGHEYAIHVLADQGVA